MIIASLYKGFSAWCSSYLQLFTTHMSMWHWYDMVHGFISAYTAHSAIFAAYMGDLRRGLHDPRFLHRYDIIHTLITTFLICVVIFCCDFMMIFSGT